MKNEYEMRGEHIAIFLSRNGKRYEAVIDAEDFEKVNAQTNTWCLSGTLDKPYVIMGYYPKNSKRYDIKLHRILLELQDDEVVDHINGNTLDNRKINLRAVSQQTNMQNRSTNRNSKSGYRGVTYDKKTGHWLARIVVDGKRYVVGRYKDVEEANTCVITARSKFIKGSIEHFNNPDGIDVQLELKEVGGLNRRNTTGVRGVSWHSEREKWQAKFMYRNKSIFVGWFDDFEEASKAIEEKKRTLTN